jgi:hypothetical protein
MLACSVEGCNRTVVSAFQETIPRPDNENVTKPSRGRMLQWCQVHQAQLRPRTMNWNGFFLSANQLQD